MKKLTLLLSLFALLLFSACIGSPAAPPEEPERTQATVRGTLELFGEAWNSANLPAYRNLLSSDSFTFYFSQGDVGQGYPVLWELPSELAAADNLYKDA